MKTLAFFLSILVLLSTAVYAADFRSVNKESIAVFLKFFPQYRQIAEKYGKNVDQMDIVSAASTYGQEINDLLDKYNVPLEQFPHYLQKVTIGMMQAQMQQNGMANMFGGFGQMADLSQAEQQVIADNLSALQSLFDEEE